MEVSRYGWTSRVGLPLDDAVHCHEFLARMVLWRVPGKGQLALSMAYQTHAGCSLCSKSIHVEINAIATIF